MIANRPPGTSYALVESPLQLLCAVEAHVAGLLGTETCLLVRDDVSGLDAALDALRQLGLPSGLSARTIRTRDLLTGRTPIHAVGDACSGVFQTLALLPWRLPHLTLFDDGLATLDLAARLSSPRRPILRPGRAVGPPRRALGHAVGHRLRRAARAGHVTLFTALHLPTEVRDRLEHQGVRVVTNSLAWLGSQPQPEPIDEPTVIVGSGLVADRLIDADRYIAWVTARSASGPTCYIPHRRHDQEVLRSIAGIPGVRVALPDAPVEVRLRGLTRGQRVVCLPTTAALLLTPLLAPHDVPVEVHDVPQAWWTPRADPELRAHLRTVVRHLPGDAAVAS